MVAPAIRYGAASVVVAFALYRGARVSANAHLLKVDRIVVHGNERLSRGEVLAVLSGLRGESLLWTDLDAWRRRLLASPWVRDAALRRSLPSTVEVVVSERLPIGIARINGGEMYLVDERGVIIDQYGPQYADFDLPIIDGL
jgi:cell division protein FtsQ